MIAPLLLSAVLTCGASSAPAASPSPNDVQVANLAKLAKVWGFLKYHHPLVTEGDGGWDQELLERIPEALAAEDEEQGRAVLEAWVEAWPTPEAPAEPRSLPEDVHLLADLDWMRDEDSLGKTLCTYLEEVYAGRHAEGPQRYVTIGRGAGNPDFSGEEAYAELEDITVEYRLLGLFRFWNIIQWWSPYRDLLDDDWHEVLEEFIPRVMDSETRPAFELELIALAAKVKDTHTNIWTAAYRRPPMGSKLLPVEVRFIEGKAFVTKELIEVEGPDALRAGDILLALDGRTMEEWVEAWSPWYPASNVPTRLRDMARYLVRGYEEVASLRIDRDGQELELEARRVEPSRLPKGVRGSRDLPGPALRLLDPEVAYLKMSLAQIPEAQSYVEQAQGTRGLIIDLRTYPEFIVHYLGRHFVQEKTPFATFTGPSLGNPGLSQWGASDQLWTKEPHYTGKLVILVDESTQSRAEYTALAFRSAPDAVVVGSTTAGADGNASYFTLPGGMRSMISGIGVFDPDRQPTQRIGIVPDVVVEPTCAAMRAGRDELVEEAIRQILGPDVSEERVLAMAR